MKEEEAPSRRRAGSSVAAKSAKPRVKPTAQPPAGAAQPKPKLKRAEKAELNRKALIYAAAEVIGECGYNGASIGRITDRAGLAAGTFYLYFESRQALFDVLLPEIAADGLQYLARSMHGAADLVDLEERGLRGELQWTRKNPGFPRLRGEAEVAAPDAFRSYLDEIIEGYLPALQRGQPQGYLQGYGPRELTVVAYMLMGARHYIHYGFQKNGRPPEWAIETYLRFIRGGLSTFVDPASAAGAESAPAPAKRPAAKRTARKTPRT